MHHLFLLILFVTRDSIPSPLYNFIFCISHSGSKSNFRAMIRFLLSAAGFCLFHGGVSAQAGIGIGSPMNILSEMMSGGYLKPQGTTTTKPPVIDVRGTYGSNGDGYDSSYKPTLPPVIQSAGGINVSRFKFIFSFVRLQSSSKKITQFSVFYF